MRQDLVSIDGIYYNIFIPEDGIKRSFSISDTDKAGRVLTGDMVRDVVGTYYNYTIEFNTNFLSTEDYDELYERLSAPVDSHKIIVPYGQTRLEFDAYMTSGEDTLHTVRGGKNKWTGLSINFIAMKPKRRP